MEVSLQASETLFSLTIGEQVFTGSPTETEALETALRAAADKLRAARAQAALTAFDRQRQQPNYWPEWSIGQGLTVLTRDALLTNQAVIRLVGAFAQEDGHSLPFSWLTWLGQTWRWERFRAALPGLGDKRIRILRDALSAFLAAYPDQLYIGRLP